MDAKGLLHAVAAALALGALALLADGADAQVATADIASAGPLDHVWIGDDLSCQISHVDDPAAYQFYPPTVYPADCGTLLSVSGIVYGPNFKAHPPVTATTSLANIAFTPISQTAVSGTGTATDPYKVNTSVSAGTVRIDQHDRYIIGTQFIMTEMTLTNTGATSADVVLYRAGDCYLGAADNGFGAIGISAPGSIACTKNPNNVPFGRFEEFIPHTPGSRYFEAGYNTVWATINGGGSFPNTCMCTTSLDNGAGLSWALTIPAGGSTTVKQETTFSIKPSPIAAFTWLQPACNDPTIDFTDTSTPGAGYTLVQSEWDWGDATTSTISPWASTTSHTFPGPGSYLVTLTVLNSAGLSDVTDLLIDVLPCPEDIIADFACAPDPAAFLRVAFKDTSKPINATVAAWAWDFGDGGSGSVAYPYHDYPVGGSYLVTLTAWTAGGAVDSVTKLCTAVANQPPAIDPVPDQTVYEGQTVRVVATGSDPEGDLLTFTWDPGPLAGLGAAFDAPEFRWTPAAGMAGDYASVGFTVTAEGGSDSTSFVVHVLRAPPPPGPGQSDADGDGVPDGHDDCPAEAGPGGCPAPVPSPSPTPAPTTAAPPPPPPPAVDTDGDGIGDAGDVCIHVPDPDQPDLDGDARGDRCDDDIDGDRVPDLDADGRLRDNCPYVPNVDQADEDGDGIGDVCEGDVDQDGLPDQQDPCPWIPDTGADADGDGKGDACADLPPSVPFAHKAAPGSVEPPPLLQAGRSSPGHAGFPWPAAAVVAAAAATGVVLVLRRLSLRR